MLPDHIEINIPNIGEDAVRQITIEGYEFAGSTLSPTRKDFCVVMFRLLPRPQAKPLMEPDRADPQGLNWMEV
jgi:hypothetical protein